MTAAIVTLDRRQNAAAQAYGHLKEWIVTGQLRPGASLSEPTIAERFGVSRTPIREVFKRLEDEGFLQIFPQVGTVVAPIDLEMVRESQFIRETLESRTIALAASLATPADLDQLDQAIGRQQRLVEAADHRGFLIADDAMHAMLMRVSGHGGAWRTIAGMKLQLDRVRYLSLEDAGWFDMIFGEHRDIVAAVRVRDVDRATGAMQAHLRTVFAAIDRIAEKHPEFFKPSEP